MIVLYADNRITNMTLKDIPYKKLFALVPHTMGDPQNVYVKLSDNGMLNLSTGYTYACARSNAKVLSLDVDVEYCDDVTIKKFHEVKNGEVILIHNKAGENSYVMKYNDYHVYNFESGTNEEPIDDFSDVKAVTAKIIIKGYKNE